jgi:DNA helicase-2/ATP-dependent DNA helicase PcrA
LGDRAQTVDERMQDVMRFLPKLFGKDVRRIEMRKSYRNTTEIAQYAQQISNVRDIEYVDRHGKEVEEYLGFSMDKVLEKIFENVRLSQEEFETAAVLTMTEKEAQDVYRYLKTKREDVHYIDRDSSFFKKGITVTTFYMAKGLEFDQVFVLSRDEKNPYWRQFGYICATRALHELYVFKDVKE